MRKKGYASLIFGFIYRVLLTSVDTH